MRLIRNFFGHLHTVNSHRFLVFVHAVKAGIVYRGMVHDLSKYNPVEFFEGVKNFQQGTRSPIEQVRELYGYSPAWLHHKGRNRHHIEYWSDYNPHEKKILPVKIPLVFVKEMFCDKVSASKIYQKEKYKNDFPLNYLLSGKDKNYMHPETYNLLVKMLTILSEQGEAEAFKYIRNLREY